MVAGLPASWRGQRPCVMTVGASFSARLSSRAASSTVGTVVAEILRLPGGVDGVPKGLWFVGARRHGGEFDQREFHVCPSYRADEWRSSFGESAVSSGSVASYRVEADLPEPL